jgi:hypothetical protein
MAYEVINIAITQFYEDTSFRITWRKILKGFSTTTTTTILKEEQTTTTTTKILKEEQTNKQQQKY